MLIGMHGRKLAGKDTAYRRLNALAPPAIRVSFADKLYRSAAEALGVTVEDLATWKVNSRVTIEVVEYPPDDCIEDPYTLRTLSVREYLQRYGTEAHRDVFGQDFWVSQADLKHSGDLVVVTDVRFENEARAIRTAGGYVVRIVGPPEVEADGDGHASEAPLPRELIDVTIWNNEPRTSHAVYEREVDRRDSSAFHRLDEQLLALVESPGRAREQCRDCLVSDGLNGVPLALRSFCSECPA